MFFKGQHWHWELRGCIECCAPNAKLPISYTWVSATLVHRVFVLCIRNLHLFDLGGFYLVGAIGV